MGEPRTDTFVAERVLMHMGTTAVAEKILSFGEKVAGRSASIAGKVMCVVMTAGTPEATAARKGGRSTVSSSCGAARRSALRARS